jgi:hypothetical protein
MCSNLSNEAGHPMTALPLSRRAINAPRQGGIATLEEAQNWTDDALLSLRQFGPSYLTAIRTLAAKSGGKEH